MRVHDAHVEVPQAAASPSGSRHLVILQHGLWGEAVNMAFLEQLLQERLQLLDTPSVVVNSIVNEKDYTYEGIDACGERLTYLVVDKLNEAAAQGEPFTHLSLIGYSMGGLMTRYAAGKLHNLGLLAGKQNISAFTNGPNTAAEDLSKAAASVTFTEGGFTNSAMNTPQLAPLAVRPVNFITIATPHLGSWALPTNTWQRIFNKVLPQMAARSGSQLLLLDMHALSRPLLVNMADPDLPFMKGLACFPHKTLLANIMHDRGVPYCTGAISETNPYEKQVAVPVDPKYPSIVHPLPKLKQKASCSKRCLSAKSAPSSPRCKSSAVTQTRGLHRSSVSPQRHTSQLTDEQVDAPSEAGLLSDEQVHAAIMSAASAANFDLHSMDPEQVIDSSMAAAAKDDGFFSRKGWGFRLAVGLLAPLSVPFAFSVLSYMIILGRRQWTAMKGRTYDHSWVEKYYHKQSAAAAANSGAAADDHSDPDLGSQHSTAHPAHSRVMQLAGKTMQVPETELHQLAVQHSQEPTEQDLHVFIDNGAKSFHVHQGLVNTPGSRERHFQQWMLKNLNMLKWKKVDVDTRHYNSHAAIMVRDPKEYKDSTDALRFLVDSMVLQGLAMSA